MGHTVNRRHLRNITVPKTWSIPRKVKYWVIKPSPGPHKMELSMPLLLWLRDYLNLVRTAREARYIIREGKVLVDGKVIKQLDYPVGLMDVIYIKDIEKYYRVLMDKRHMLILKEIYKEEANIKPLRVIKKIMVKNSRIQVTTHDGRNFIVDNSIKPGDTLVYDIKNKNIRDVIKMEKGALVYFYYGAKVGTIGKIKDIKIYRKSFGHKRFIVYEDLETGEEKETVWEYGFVIGKEKPIIDITM